MQGQVLKNVNIRGCYNPGCHGQSTEVHTQYHYSNLKLAKPSYMNIRVNDGYELGLVKS